MARMRAIEVEKPGSDFRLVQVEIPEPRENEVLVRVEACGVCRGDAIVKEGIFSDLTYPRIPGHEVIGTIAALGSGVEGWSIGQRVGIGWRGGSCRKCPACRRGDFQACEQPLTTGISADGGYADYMTARVEDSLLFQQSCRLWKRLRCCVRGAQLSPHFAAVTPGQVTWWLSKGWEGWAISRFSMRRKWDSGLWYCLGERRKKQQRSSSVQSDTWMRKLPMRRPS